MNIAWDQEIKKHYQPQLNGGGLFLQSSGWADFQKSLGRDVFFIDSDNFLGALFGYRLPLRQSYLYCPRGPIQKKEGSIDDFLKKAKKINQGIFLKIEPTFSGFKKEDLKKSDKAVQPQKSLVLDLSLNQDELLGQMHQKTRYNIRLSQKKDVEIEFLKEVSDENLNEFWELNKKTTQRDKFKSHDKAYYQKMLKALGPQEMAELVLVRHKNQVVSAAVLIYFNQTATYLHGASDHQFRKLMANHFMQWASILRAQNKGCLFYDFWGIDESKWPGITRFKRGFGGYEVNYSDCWDFVFHPFWYRLYNLVRRIL